MEKSCLEGLSRCWAIVESTKCTSRWVGVSDVRRHPMRQRRLVETLDRWAMGKVEGTLARLQSSGQAQKRVYRSETFWEYAGGDLRRRGETP
jgi:hypothetical protein